MLPKKVGNVERHYISKGGGANLIRSTLSSLPIYYMSIFHLLGVFRSKLNHIQRNFLWGGGHLEKKPHLVKWATIYLSKENGGLGVKYLGRLNKALFQSKVRELRWKEGLFRMM